VGIIVSSSFAGVDSGEADGSQLFHPLLGQEDRDALAALGGDERHTEAEHQREPDHRDRENEAGRDDFEQGDPAFVGDAPAGAKVS